MIAEHEGSRQMDNLQQQLGQTLSLLANTTGVLDLIRLHNSQGDDWLLPSALVLSQERQTLEQDSQYVEYEGRSVPVYRGLLPKVVPEQVFVLVLEGEHDIQRLAVLVDQRPEGFRANISNLRDVEEAQASRYEAQVVQFHGERCVVPNIDELTQHLCL